MKRLPILLLCLCTLHLPIAAHVLDSYLQIAQVALSPDGVRIELGLIPGVDVADRVFALIDADGDGRISPAEEQAYVRCVMQDVALQIDGKTVPLALTIVEFPSRSEMNEGVGEIRLNFAAETSLNLAGEHRIIFRNDHLPELGVYLANVLVPSTDAIEITGQRRDPLQHEFQADFRVLPAQTTTSSSRYAGVFLIVICLALFFTHRTRLSDFLRRRRAELI